MNLAQAFASRLAQLTPSLLCVAPAGCIVVAEDDPETGFLAVDWTLEGTVDPYLCTYYGVAAMELLVYDDWDYFVTEVETPCEYFGVHVELYPGIYHVDATLIDAFNRAASYPVPLYGLDVYAHSELVVPVDYPPSAFYY